MIKKFTLLSATCGAVAVLGVGAASASAKTTLKLYASAVSDHAYSPSGQPISTTALPTPGDYTVEVENAYVGTSASHASKRKGTIKVTCTLVRIVSLTDIPTSCKSVLTIGRSSLTAKATVNVANLPKSYTAPIVGGTGAYRRATGRWATTVLSTTRDNLVLTFKP